MEQKNILMVQDMKENFKIIRKMEKENVEYEVEFKDDLFDSEGVYKQPLESRDYKGQFKNGNMNGIGKNKFKDGSIYEGHYKNGLKHGSGKYIQPNRKVFMEVG